MDLYASDISSSSWRAYHRVTRTALYGFLMALPLLLLYEVFIILTNFGRVVQVRVGAEVWVKRALALLGGTGWMALGLVVLLVGAFIIYHERKKRIPIRPRYFTWMIGESALYAVVLALVISATVGLLFACSLAAVGRPLLAGPQLAAQGFWTKLVLSVGAGLYEELLFRVILVGGLYGLLKHVLPARRHAYAVAAVVGALLFSGVHYTGVLGDVFTLSSFTFRFLFGLALNVVFLVRGFGIAAWTHALYDLMLVASGAA